MKCHLQKLNLFHNLNVLINCSKFTKHKITKSLHFIVIFFFNYDKREIKQNKSLYYLEKLTGLNCLKHRLMSMNQKLRINCECFVDAILSINLSITFGLNKFVDAWLKY